MAYTNGKRYSYKTRAQAFQNLDDVFSAQTSLLRDNLQMMAAPKITGEMKPRASRRQKAGHRSDHAATGNPTDDPAIPSAETKGGCSSSTKIQFLD